MKRFSKPLYMVPLCIEQVLYINLLFNKAFRQFKNMSMKCVRPEMGEGGVGLWGATAKRTLSLSLFQGVRNPQRADPHLLLLILEELREMRTLRWTGGPRGPGLDAGYWTRVAQRTNIAFCTFYLTTVSLFLIFLVMEWSS